MDKPNTDFREGLPCMFTLPEGLRGFFVCLQWDMYGEDFSVHCNLQPHHSVPPNPTHRSFKQQVLLWFGDPEMKSCPRCPFIKNKKINTESAKGHMTHWARVTHKILSGKKGYRWKWKITEWLCCPDWSGKVIPSTWSQKGEEPSPGGAMTTSDRERRAKWPIVVCSAGCLDWSPCSSSSAFYTQGQEDKIIAFVGKVSK